MSAKEQSKKQEKEYVAIRNDDARMYTLSYLEEEKVSQLAGGVMIRERPFKNLNIAPGINFVDKADFDRCVLSAECDDGRVAGYDSLSVVHVEHLPVMQAKSLLALTNSKKTLEIWKSLETRQAVLAAIEEKLA
jgi:hypothetical protein